MQIDTCRMKNAVGKTLLGFAENKYDDAMLLVWHDDTYTLINSEGDEDGSILDDEFSISEDDLNRFEIADLIKAKVHPEIIRQSSENLEKIKVREAERQMVEKRQTYERLKKEFEG